MKFPDLAVDCINQLSVLNDITTEQVNSCLQFHDQANVPEAFTRALLLSDMAETLVMRDNFRQPLVVVHSASTQAQPQEQQMCEARLRGRLERSGSLVWQQRLVRLLLLLIRPLATPRLETFCEGIVPRLNRSINHMLRQRYPKPEELNAMNFNGAVTFAAVLACQPTWLCSLVRRRFESFASVMVLWPQLTGDLYLAGQCLMLLCCLVL